jgi:hypothetical protein
MKIKGSQNSIGIVDLFSPLLCSMTERQWLVNTPFDIALEKWANAGTMFGVQTWSRRGSTTSPPREGREIVSLVEAEPYHLQG